MSTINMGKRFESKFMADWKKSFPQSFIFRLKDDTSQFKFSSKNPCDFICFVDGLLFLVETKTVHDRRFPLSNLTQYDKLISYKDIEGVIPCVVIWYIENDVVLAAHIKTIESMKEEKVKSILYDITDCKYKLLSIPSKKKRVFMDSDYRNLKLLSEEQ